MKNIVLNGFMLIAAFAVIISFASCEDSVVEDLEVLTNTQDDTSLSETEELTSENIDDNTKSSLVYMREEEKLAHDVYVQMFQLWGLSTFDNISKSETIHTNSVKGLLDYYNIEDPALAEEGIFVNTELQQLYDLLIDMGDSSLIDGLIVGATIEEVDIIDLDEAIENCEVDTIITVYGRLRKGSINHLKAFVGQLASNGIDYSPQYLSKEEFYAIINN
ncbi:MAG: DUF2202 domain-containing protein [Bacteroidales bacterium]|nr:DUF2202 domain-containing protein [Bacteroidales bacterium]